MALAEGQHKVEKLEHSVKLNLACAFYKKEVMEETNRTLRLAQLEANLETCNCASKLVHARCVMRELEMDLLHQRFKVEQARKRIAKDKLDIGAQKAFAKELREQVNKLTFQRDSFHETTMNLIAELDKANTRKCDLDFVKLVGFC